MYYRLIWHIIRENLNIIISFYNILKYKKIFTITQNYWIKHSFIVQYS